MALYAIRPSASLNRGFLRICSQRRCTSRHAYTALLRSTNPCRRSNASTLRALNVESFTKLLTDAGIFYPTGSLRWNTLPGKLWETNQYITGIPRRYGSLVSVKYGLSYFSCVPKVVDDKMAGDEASLMMKWKKSQRIDLQRAIDSGLLKIIPRDPGMLLFFI